MKRLNKLRPMLIIVLISQLFFACANDQDEFLADNVEEVVGDFMAATIYYEVGSDKYAIVYTKNGDKKTFNNGKKVGQTQEEAPDPIVAPENAENVEIIEGEAWTDEEAMVETSNPNAPVSSDLAFSVNYWQDLYDQEWVENDNRMDKDDAYSKSLSKNLDQEYYYLGYYIDGLVQIWQATGDNAYLDTALDLINNTVNDAVDMGNGYKGWPSQDGTPKALWDSFYWRHVATLVRVLHESPNLRSTNPQYQQAYVELLNFSEVHIWDRWEAAGIGNFYRSRTHMASHWARIGMELYMVTGKAKYREVFENISFKGMPNRPSNLRDRIYFNPDQTDAYVWDSQWDVNQGGGVQDTSHAGAIISFIVNAADNNMYWNSNDITAFTNTLMKVIWPAENGSQMAYNVDGTEGFQRAHKGHEWLTLGRYSREVQERIFTDYIPNTQFENVYVYGTQAMGAAALNAKILTDGAPVYPEQ
ncbi:hypothetical protein E7Z59_13555 [Robertkochia marina]|uniref:Alginate lyase domain-containing protein n=1 Tax=Robertkochia marina TaxID=1227945 RepID=A0A4S3LYW3_9FLAO|nr:hypothetical protein [Robertkochia marina]THD66799.1 hypothetical protein E7Z59_13555 [Robertkochia marina]TRZ41910.1 hypothetical protein D3A96_12525 [Robertkochia marina]